MEGENVWDLENGISSSSPPLAVVDMAVVAMLLPLFPVAERVIAEEEVDDEIGFFPFPLPEDDDGDDFDLEE